MTPRKEVPEPSAGKNGRELPADCHQEDGNEAPVRAGSVAIFFEPKKPPEVIISGGFLLSKTAFRSPF